jgi:hypothetical protein
MSPANRVTAPTIEPGSKVKGPASYFPSIEATYGRPMQEWLDLVTSKWTAGSSHMEIVTTLKDEHGMGHGHANAIVAYVKAALVPHR